MWFLESSCFRPTFCSQRFNVSKIPLKTGRWCFYYNFTLSSKKSGWETSFLVRSEALGLCFNMLTGDPMYFDDNREKFTQQVQTQLSS